MYNGIGLTTPRGSGTNGYVQRNLSFVRKTKEKIKEQSTEDNAVRAYDPELIEHERRRQIEVRCLELQELLEEQGIDEAEIDVQVTKFRAKLLEEKKSMILRDSSGRAMVKDSHELAVAQEDKNARAKNAFGIRDDFIPGSSLDSKRLADKATDAAMGAPAAKVAKKEDIEVVPEKKSGEAKKSKNGRSPSSSSSSDSSSSSSSDSSSEDSSGSSSDSSSSDSSSSSESSSSEESESEEDRRRKKKSKSKKSPHSKKESRRRHSDKDSRKSRRSRSRSRSKDRDRKKADRRRK